MSLNVVPFKSLGAVSGFLFDFCSNYRPMAVSVAVCDIFNVKEWPDLETRLAFVQGHGNGTNNRSHTSLNTSVVCTHVPGICKHKHNTVTFKSRLRVTQGH